MQGNRMKEITLYRHERMLFALLRASLHERKTEITLFLDSTDEEWKQCHRLAVSQGVMALAWDGVMRLPAELQPPLSVKLAWAAAVERYEKNIFTIAGRQMNFPAFMRSMAYPLYR